MIRHYIYSCIFLGSNVIFSAAKAQEIKNLTFNIDGSIIRIYYDLIGEQQDQYNISVFSSFDNYSNQLEFVSGEVGEKIAPGTNKSIIWDAKKEFGDYSGNLRIRIKARLIPFMHFTNISQGSSFRRGKNHLINWESQTDRDLYFQLFRGENMVYDIGNVPNRGMWNWYIPKNISRGKDYRIKAIFLNRSVFSDDFKIAPKIPLLVKMLPIVGGIGGLAVIFMSEAGGIVDQPQGNEIPDPLLPD